MVVTGRTLKGGRGNCRRGGRGPFSTGPERSVGAPAGLGNPADCRRFAAPLLARARTLSSRCAPQPAITYLDDFQISSGRHFFARCLHHLPPSPSLSLVPLSGGTRPRNRRKPCAREREGNCLARSLPAVPHCVRVPTGRRLFSRRSPKCSSCFIYTADSSVIAGT